MQVKSFYRTQRELAIVLNVIIDAYFDEGLSEEQLYEQVQKLYVHNRGKMIKNGGFTTVLKQQCGKRRLEVVEKILNAPEQPML